MAYKLNKILPNGVTATYWKIGEITELNYLNNVAHVIVYGYVDEEVRRENPGGIVSKKEFKVTVDNIDGNIREEIYTKLKTLQPASFIKIPSQEEPEPYFKDAIGDN